MVTIFASSGADAGHWLDATARSRKNFFYLVPATMWRHGRFSARQGSEARLGIQFGAAIDPSIGALVRSISLRHLHLFIYTRTQAITWEFEQCLSLR